MLYPYWVYATFRTLSGQFYDAIENLQCAVAAATVEYTPDSHVMLSRRSSRGSFSTSPRELEQEKTYYKEPNGP